MNKMNGVVADRHNRERHERILAAEAEFCGLSSSDDDREGPVLRQRNPGSPPARSKRARMMVGSPLVKCGSRSLKPPVGSGSEAYLEPPPLPIISDGEFECGYFGAADAVPCISLK